MRYPTGHRADWPEHTSKRPTTGREQAQELEWFRWLADAVAVLHLSYLAYLVAGGYLAWWLRKTFPLHAAAVAWGFAVVATPLGCPLTSLQNALLARAGEPYLPGTFQQTYLHDVLYPERFQPAVYAAAAILVAVSWGFTFVMLVSSGRRGRFAPYVRPLLQLPHRPVERHPAHRAGSH